MKLLTPIGLLGLLALAVLILIYLLKPNYQQKVISSTFVWKLSLKYRKKRLPINRFRNILLIICQILIFVLCAMILTQPFTEETAEAKNREKLFILDASASMLVTHSESSTETTRFRRAVDGIRDAASEAVADGNSVSVIVAGETATFLVRNIDSDNISELDTALDELKCTYGVGDVEGAIGLAEEIVEQNPDTEVILYTATEYVDNGGVTIVNVSADGEWNVGILNAQAVIDAETNCYTVSVDVAAYGRDVEIDVFCDIYGVNADYEYDEGVAPEADTVTLMHRVRLEDGVTVNTVFNARDEVDRYIFSYDHIRVRIEVADGLANDNDYYLYDGKRDTIKIQYYSTAPSTFFFVYFQTLISHTKDFYNLEITEVPASGKYETTGFDFYVFEHKMPDNLPTDGAVLLVDPDKAPIGADFDIAESVDGTFSLSMGQPHTITQFLDPTNVSVTRYTNITRHDGYEELLYSAGVPVFLYKNTPDAKVAVLAIDISHSELSVKIEYPIMMCLLFDEFLPRAVEKNVYEVGDSASFRARTASLNVDGGGKSETYDEFPVEYKFVTPGVYTLSQPRIDKDTIIDNVFVKIPSSESNTHKSVDSLTNPYADQASDSATEDLLLWFAIALVALLFVEWLLQMREQF